MPVTLDVFVDNPPAGQPLEVGLRSFEYFPLKGDSIHVQGAKNPHGYPLQMEGIVTKILHMAATTDDHGGGSPASTRLYFTTT